MATEHIFKRLRAMQTRKGQSLSELIAEACEVGDRLVGACEQICSAHPKDSLTSRIACEAARRAYADNGHTPDNGKAVA